jgi:hypothetical protein
MNIEQGTENDEGKIAQTFGLENRLIDLALAFEIHHSWFDIRYCRALILEHLACRQRPRRGFSWPILPILCPPAP